MSRLDDSGKKEVTVHVIENSQVVKQLISLIGNEELMRLTVCG